MRRTPWGEDPQSFWYVEPPEDFDENEEPYIYEVEPDED